MPTVVSPSRGEDRGPLRRRSLHRETVSVNKILGCGRFPKSKLTREIEWQPHVGGRQHYEFSRAVCTAWRSMLCRIKNASCNQCMDFCKTDDNANLIPNQFHVIYVHFTITKTLLIRRRHVLHQHSWPALRPATCCLRYARSSRNVCYLSLSYTPYLVHIAQ
jgi:hypothetical protein